MQDTILEIESQLHELKENKKKAERRALRAAKAESAAARKERTRRLIRIGALAEKYFDARGADPERVEELLAAAVRLPAVKKIIDDANAKTDAAP